MASSLVRGRYVISEITNRTKAIVIENGAVFQDNGEIVAVGPADELARQYPADEVIGSSAHVVLPGLVNGHHHIGLTPFQLGAADHPLEVWNAARLAARDVDPYLDTLYSAFEMIQSGVTTVQHLHTIRTPPSTWPAAAREVLRAYRDIGMRVSYACMLRDQNRVVYGPDEEFLGRLPAPVASEARAWLEGITASAPWQLSELFVALYQECGRNRAEKVRIALSPVNVLYCSDDLLATVKDHAKQYGVPIHIHLLATKYERLYAERRFGTTAVRHLHDLEVLGLEVTLGHGVWLTDEDADLVAETGTSICHNPSSNLRIRSGVAPINDFAERGVRIAIGTDEAGINDDRDMLQEMRLALFLHRTPGLDDRVPTSSQVLHMATQAGAHTTGFGDRAGTLEPGKGADLVLMRLENLVTPYLDANVSIVDAVVHRGRSTDVDTVLIGGEVVLRDGRFTRVDRDAVRRALTESLRRPLQAHETRRRELSRRLFPHVQRFYDDWQPEGGEPFYRLNQRR
jgi:cytosine/adenosine deaminase-related metal-dependent hydrolase